MENNQIDENPSILSEKCKEVVSFLVVNVKDVVRSDLVVCPMRLSEKLIKRAKET